jgi:hypothetical protein
VWVARKRRVTYSSTYAFKNFYQHNNYQTELLSSRKIQILYLAYKKYGSIKDQEGRPKWNNGIME